MEQLQGTVTPPANDIVSSLKQRSKDNEVFRAICRSFAGRKRTKETLTVRGLMARLEREGYSIPVELVKNEFNFLAKIGIGHIKRSANGKILALTGIKVTLQSIGQAASSESADLKKWNKQRRFKKLQPQVKSFEAPPATPKASIPKKKYTANLVLNIEGNAVNVASFEMAPEELGAFMIEFSHLTKSARKEV